MNSKVTNFWLGAIVVLQAASLLQGYQTQDYLDWELGILAQTQDEYVTAMLDEIDGDVRGIKTEVELINALGVACHR